MKQLMFFFLLAAFLFIGCADQTAQPIVYGSDICDFCQMQISDHAFGTELITPKGKVYKFDSVECLVSFAQNSEYDPKETAVFVTSMIEPDVLFDAKTAMFVVSKEIQSPMGANLAAFRNHQDAIKTIKDSTAVHYSWNQLLKTKFD
ncbi:MAG: nitrous oxide reductase accessory protein NosL [Ignavibacteriales bacterium]|nr:MAG: hypothetical protein F9K26_01470 [Ignavibacteriaceae bacterium]MBW7872080.1 nitrous oxide reductase accessory protein NosL [Ignavibacteria bacterium]MCZ2143714.1 nitrous oxide reductase accessory protein NosL [Ignavibacteriales bacterium]OQY77555.1 MAG: hypothetical protein B6D45_02715 [Ignavibacteriales bacterium UTCHB3]MBV6446023.1 hypothetical protein [Ignavibacteriaceae bacterium]